MDRITASVDTLMRQAPMTAHLYADAHRKYVRETFSELGASDQSKLVGQLALVSAIDFATACLCAAIQDHGVDD